MDEFLKCMRAANDETRVKILKFLMVRGKSCVCELEISLEMIQSRLSRHLKILKESGFLGVERLGSYAYYYLAPKSALHEILLKEIDSMALALAEKQTVCAS